MAIEEFIRFTVPGSIAVLPLALGLWFLKRPDFREGAGAFWAVVAGMAVVTAGYTIHQIWMCWNHNHWYRERETIDRIGFLIKEKGKTAKAVDPVSVWNYFFHCKDCDEGLREQVKRWWYFVYSLMSASIACAFGSLIAVVWGVFFLCRPRPMDCSGWKMVIIAGIYGVLSWFFCWRGKQEMVDVVKLEVEMIERPEIKKVIERIVARQPIDEKAKRGCLPRIIGRS